MANTNLMTKQAFLNWIKKEIGDKDIIILSNSINGTTSVTKKKGLNIPFSFDTSVF